MTRDTIKLAPFKELMLRTCGLAFEREREATLIAGLHGRMASRGIERADDYHALLICDRDEFHSLVELLTVNETYFFREPDHLRLMIERLIPEIMAQGHKEPLRIVSAGCSTGEEPYSIAMMLRERHGAESERLFAITGVDIDTSAIAGAKLGVYGKGSFRGMDKGLLGRYFEPCGRGEYRVREEIRKQVVFEVVNLLGNVYPVAMQQPDVVLYRNVSIYFPGQVQREIFGRLAGLLNDGGYLLVGATETIHHDVGILTLVERDGLFFYRKSPGNLTGERRSRRRETGASEQPRGGMTRGAASDSGHGRGEVARLRHERTTALLSTGRAPLRHPSPAAPRDVVALFDEALELARQNRPDEAIGLLDNVIQQDGSFVKAHSLKGSILLDASRFDEACSACGTALDKDPLCLEAYLMLGIIARHGGNDDEAFRRFREAIYLDTSCWLAHFYSAEIVFARGDRKRARSGYETTLRILENGSLSEHEKEFFPLRFKTDQFIAICRHKLSLIKEPGN